MGIEGQQQCGAFLDEANPSMAAAVNAALVAFGLAMAAKTRQIMAFYVGDRSRKSFKKLWAMIPKAYRQHATFYTDQYVVYTGVIPAAQHQPIGK